MGRLLAMRAGSMPGVDEAPGDQGADNDNDDERRPLARTPVAAGSFRLRACGHRVPRLCRRVGKLQPVQLGEVVGRHSRGRFVEDNATIA